MGLPAVFLAFAGVSAISSIAGGISANRAAKDEAALIGEQGRLAQEEAAAEAQRRANEVRKFSRTQSLAFLKNGVTLEGSPLLAIGDTITQGQEEVDAISKSGDAERNLYNRRAAITRNQGRAALIGGIGQAASTGVSAYGTGKKGGLF